MLGELLFRGREWVRNLVSQEGEWMLRGRNLEKLVNAGRAPLLSAPGKIGDEPIVLCQIPPVGFSWVDWVDNPGLSEAFFRKEGRGGEMAETVFVGPEVAERIEARLLEISQAGASESDE